MIGHLNDLSCIGVEAALDWHDAYVGWAFVAATPTTRWQLIGGDALGLPGAERLVGLELLEGGNPQAAPFPPFH